MNASSDPQLLREFAGRRSEAAFTELVRRHIDFVHSTACRLTNDPHLAKDVSQGVFVAMAKEAGKLAKHPVLHGWLHRTTRNIASQAIRTEVRRRNREKEAATMHAHPDADPTWDDVSPVLDAALADLAGPDRDAVLLRYFENKPAHEIAAILGISAEAAQKRVSRAVERLRGNFARRGITSGTAGLTGVISANAVQAAPAGLATSVSSAALTAASASSPFLLTNFLLKFALGTAAVIAISTAVHQTTRVSELKSVNQALQHEVATPSQLGTGSGRGAASADDTTETIPEAESTTTAGAGEEEGGAMVMASFGFSTDIEDFSLFAPAGRGITTGAAEVAGLDAAKRKAVDKILRAAWKAMENDFASRAVKVPDAPAGATAYSIPARADGGSGPRRQLEADLDAEVGPAKRKILMGNLQPYDFFAGFGAMDVRLEFQKNGCESWTKDPRSGKQQLHMSMGSDGFVENYGASFELPQDPSSFHQ